jgi:hypothetical protein
MRDSPQLSKPPAMPHSLPCAAQNCGSASGEQPQTFGIPPPPQLSSAAQVPQLAVRDAPQLSSAVTLLQLFASRVQKATSVSGVQLQPPSPQLDDTQAPIAQDCPLGQITPTHAASAQAPFKHTAPAGHCVPLQAVLRQVPPAQACPAGHTTPMHAEGSHAP